MEGIENAMGMSMGELKQLKDDQEIMLGHIERSLDQLAEYMNEFKVGREHNLEDVQRSDENLRLASDVEQCKDVRKITLAVIERSNNLLNPAEVEIQRGALFYFKHV